MGQQQQDQMVLLKNEIIMPLISFQQTETTSIDVINDEEWNTNYELLLDNLLDVIADDLDDEAIPMESSWFFDDDIPLSNNHQTDNNNNTKKRKREEETTPQQGCSKCNCSCGDKKTKKLNTSRRNNRTIALGCCPKCLDDSKYKMYSILSCKECKLIKVDCYLEGCPCLSKGKLIHTNNKRTYLHVMNGDDGYVVIRDNRLPSMIERINKRMKKIQNQSRTTKY